MRTPIKAALTALCLVLVAWPLLFWGKPARPGAPDRGKPEVESVSDGLIFNLNKHDDLLW